MDISYLLEEVVELSKQVKTVSVFEAKKALEYIPGVCKEHMFDGILAAYLLNPLKNDYDFMDVAREQLDILMDDKMEELQKCFYEAYAAFAAKELLDKKLAETNMDRLFYEVEMPLVFTLFDMEQNGVKVDGASLKVYGDQLATKIVEVEKRIYEQTGEEFNINSPKQLGVILFDKMGLPNGKKTKTGYSTSADVLEKLAAEYPVVSDILEYRQLTKLKSTYADGLANYIGIDGRIHGKFNQTITATGRISSTEPNLQNIPVRMELGRLIRKVFSPY